MPFYFFSGSFTKVKRVNPSMKKSVVMSTARGLEPVIFAMVPKENMPVMAASFEKSPQKP